MPQHPAQAATNALTLTLSLAYLAGAGVSVGAQANQDRHVQSDRADGGGLRAGRPHVSPARVDTPPVVDGRLDDPVWREAAHITDLFQRRPLDGAPATETSDVYMAFDSTHLYFGFHAHYADPGMMRANRRDRDEAIDDDLFVVYFDPFLDQQRAYVFSVNGYGVQGDAILQANSFDGGRFGVPRGDESWNVLFDTAGTIVNDGFTAEMAIPFKSLRYPQRDGGVAHQWGLQIARTIGGKDEAVVWSPTSRDVRGFLAQMGLLDGMTDLSTSRNIEILPTFTAINFASVDRTTGAFEREGTSPEGGVNFKYGLASNLTADFTLNPDFSQIESDQPQIEVNQRFALFFPELRPFFLEGAEIFDIPSVVTAVHTRTIVDPFYGAKITGKVGKTTIGVMYANDEAPAETDNSADTALGESAQVLVGRVRYDLYSESHVGAVFTNRETAAGHSRLVGLDSTLRLGDTHSLGLRAMGTDHRDEEGLDTTGHLLDARFSKFGRNLRYGAGAFVLSPDFKTDVGFVRRTDQRFVGADGGYRWWPETWLLNWGPEFFVGRVYDFDDILQDENAGAGLNFAFANNMFLATNIFRFMERYEGIDFFKTQYRLFFRSNASRLVEFGVGPFWGEQIRFDPDDPYLGYERGINAFVNLRPTSRLQSEIQVNSNRFTDPRNNDELAFDVNIFRALTTYQLTNRFLFRNISEYNTFDQTVDLNFLFTYRINAGTVFYIGYDDHYQQADLIEGDVDSDDEPDPLFFTTRQRQTNRAVFLKLQYLFRY